MRAHTHAEPSLGTDSSSLTTSNLPAATRGRALVHGFGAIGRAVLGEVFRKSGFRLLAVDRAKARNDLINARGAFEIVVDGRPGPDSPSGREVGTIDQVTVIDAAARSAVHEAYVRADIAGLALVEDQLPAAAYDIAKGLVLRTLSGRPALPLVIALNRVDAADHVRAVLRAAFERLAPGHSERFLASVVLLGTVVDRMARNAGPDDADPSAVYAEPARVLVIEDKHPLVATLAGVLAVDCLQPYADMKLYLSNCAHAVVAYRGHARGHTLVHEALADDVVRAEAEAVLREEAGPALIAKWNLPADVVYGYAASVLVRFANPGLRDEVARVARDPMRKLGRADRLVGPARMALSYGIEPRSLVKTIASALAYAGVTRAPGEALRAAGLGDDAHDRRLVHLVERAFQPARRGARGLDIDLGRVDALAS